METLSSFRGRKSNDDTKSIKLISKLNVKPQLELITTPLIALINIFVILVSKIIAQ